MKLKLAVVSVAFTIMSFGPTQAQEIAPEPDPLIANACVFAEDDCAFLCEITCILAQAEPYQWCADVCCLLCPVDPDRDPRLAKIFRQAEEEDVNQCGMAPPASSIQQSS